MTEAVRRGGWWGSLLPGVLLGCGAVAWVCAAEPGSAGKTYRWAGEDGVQYGEHPPPGVEAEEVRIYDADFPESRRAREALGEKLLDAAERRKEQEEQRRLQKEDEARREVSVQRCREAKAALAALNQGRRLQYKSEDGALAYMTEEQKQQRIAQARKVEQESCAGQ